MIPIGHNCEEGERMGDVKLQRVDGSWCFSVSMVHLTIKVREEEGDDSLRTERGTSQEREKTHGEAKKQRKCPLSYLPPTLPRDSLLPPLPRTSESPSYPPSYSRT
jgi:hypothetical protein